MTRTHSKTSHKLARLRMARKPWEEAIPELVDKWLFTSSDPLPDTLLVPMENPHLYSHELWHEQFGAPIASNGLVDLVAMNRSTVGIARPVLGGSGVAMLVDAASRRGTEFVIGVGFCGSTSTSLHCGDLLVASSAVVLGGSDCGYAPAATSVAASSQLVARAPAHVLLGAVASVSAVHLETQELVETCESTGIFGLDMESAALYSVAARRGIDAISVLVASDHALLGCPPAASSLVSGVREALKVAHSLAAAVSDAET
ncbi:MAG: hypothetical protein ACRCYU_11720 [Nocardioides sp.]